MNFLFKGLILFILGILIFYFSANPLSAPIRSDLTFPKILGVLGGLFVLVLLIERATEIFIAIWREAPTEKLREEVTALQNIADKAADLTTKKSELAVFQANTKGIALLVGFTLAAIACSGGIGILDAVVDTSKASPGFMRGIDIILTAGLLAGGSDSFHQFVSALETFFQNAKEKK